MRAFSESIGVDLEMWEEDLEGSRAHATMLAEVGLLAPADRDAILAGLDRIGEELRAGSWKPGIEDEDIHMAVEARLGPAGARLHTARSRNDQVATDTRLWLIRRLRALEQEIRALVGALLDRVGVDGDVLVPGYTHLQRGQPVLLGHHLLAYAWMFRRDAGRCADAASRMDECPLGACAMAGTPLAIDRRRTAELLGFARPVPNAMDAVASRDHAIEAASTCAILATHLSRLAEDLVFWSTEEVGLVRLGEGYATGSSIMPQKRNPDAAELLRGRSARVVGDVVALLTLVKGLPMAYNRDLQEDRRALFDAVGTARASTRIAERVVATLEVRRDRFERELVGSFALATEIADWLVGRGVAFREAHHAAGRIVAAAESRGGDLSSIAENEWASFHPALNAGVVAWLDPRAAAGRRTSLGGTAPSEIAAQVGALREWLAR
jgi:argininosuccinate lyase